MDNQLRELWRVGFRWLLSLGMLSIGLLHFVATDFFVQIVPPRLPAPVFLVWLSGICEISLGLLLLAERTRRWAGYGLVALYVAVFPANIYMAVSNVQLQGMPGWFRQPSPLALWLRLPLQFAFIAWALWVSRPSGGAATRARL